MRGGAELVAVCGKRKNTSSVAEVSETEVVVGRIEKAHLVHRGRNLKLGSNEIPTEVSKVVRATTEIGEPSNRAEKIVRRPKKNVDGYGSPCGLFKLIKYLTPEQS
ncbi:hypothetical protein RND81_06G071800 [Saponaria officinalis]|uniref:Uncharacterized protein n=1 Tax=Saponaria officinalis TaxID=3572 RepID=A0AAW1K8Y9_SAPOF